MAIAAIPFAKGLHAIDFDIGILYVIAVSSLGVVGILLAGWSSNNKYSLIGAMRSGAQIVSYELSVGLSLLTIIVLAGTMQFSQIVEGQATGWFIFKGHIPAFIAFVLFLIASTAETNRGPFDLAEAESELTAGFHTEYSGIKFAFFFLAEYMNMFIVASIAATVFLGGWMAFHIGGWTGFNHIMDFIPPFVWYIGKTFFVIFLMMWFKWTFPRLRIDQLLTLEWKYLLPINLVNILVMAFVVLMGWHF
jgi:NADH-quinone oxidoreductase subunit H